MGLSPAQLEQRKKLITASDAAAILGLSPWRSAIDVWNEKVGEGSSFSGNFRTRRGHAIEPLLLEWLAEQIAPLVVRPAGDTTLTHPILSWLGATPDALVFENEGDERPIALGEAKSTGLIDHWRDEDGEPKVPDYYHPQVVVQMAVVGVPRTYVVAEMIDPRESEPWLIEVERDAELEAIVLEELDGFRRKYIDTGRPPPFEHASYSEVATIFRRANRAELVPATEKDEQLAAAYLAATKAKRAAEAIAERVKAALCAHIADAEGLAGSTWRATWKERAARHVEYERKAHRHFDLREVHAKETGV